MAEKKEPEDLEEELEPEGCMGLGWGTMLVLAVIVIVAGLAVMGLVRVYDLQRERAELEMMRNAAFQSAVTSVIADLTAAQKALAANNPDAALQSIDKAERGLINARGQASDAAAVFLLTAQSKCKTTKEKIRQRLQAASMDSQADVQQLVESVKLLRLSD
jgi:cytoskeletal protein RodZ